MAARPTLSLSAQTRINELKALGIEPTLDEILWLHETGKRIEQADRQDPENLLGMPVRVGNVILYPFTIGASIWWTDVCCSVIGPKHPLADYAAAFALANARAPEVLKQLGTYEAILTAVRDWMRELGCNKRALDHAVALCLRIDVAREPSKAEESDRGWRSFVSILMDTYGGDLDSWLWEHTSDQGVTLLRAYAERQQVHGRKVDPHSPLAVAVVAQQRAFAAIIEAHKPKDSAA